MHVPARQRVNSLVGGRLLAGGLEQWPTGFPYPTLTQSKVLKSSLCYIGRQWRRNKCESGRHRSGAWHRKTFFGRAPPLFGSKSTISRFGLALS